MGAEQKKTVVLLSALFVVVAICGGLIGWMLATPSNSQAIITDAQPKNEIQRLIAGMKEGDTVEINLQENQTPESGTSTGSKGADVLIKEDKAYFRAFSWFGLGGPEAAAKDQGFADISKGGTEVGSVGQQKGYGILEQLWNWIKSVFWVLVFGAIILGVLAFVPATAPFARAVWRIIGSIFPVLGSATEWLAGNKKQQKFEQVVTGGEAFKKNLDASDLSAEDKAKVKEMFQNSHKSTQDADIQKEIRVTTA